MNSVPRLSTVKQNKSSGWFGARLPYAFIPFYWNIVADWMLKGTRTCLLCLYQDTYENKRIIMTLFKLAFHTLKKQYIKDIFSSMWINVNNREYA